MVLWWWWWWGLAVTVCEVSNENQSRKPKQTSKPAQQLAAELLFKEVQRKQKTEEVTVLS